LSRVLNRPPRLADASCSIGPSDYNKLCKAGLPSSGPVALMACV